MARAHRRARAELARSRMSVAPLHARTLQQCSPLFCDWPVSVLESVSSAAALTFVPGGETIVYEGDTPAALFVVARGAVEVVPPRLLLRRGVHREELLEGESLAAHAALAAHPAATTFRALEDCAMWEVPRASLLAAVEQLDQAAQTDVWRLARTQHMAEMPALYPLYPSTLRRQLIFAEWPDAALATVIQNAQPVSFERGDVVFRQGAPPTSEMPLYLLSSGAVTVSVGPKTLAKLGSGVLLGELSVIFLEAREHTVTAASKCDAYMLRRQHFMEPLRKDPALFLHVKRVGNELRASRMFPCTEDALRAIPLLRECPAQILHKLHARFRPKVFEARQPLVTAGTVRDRVLLIADGTAERLEDSKQFGPGEAVGGAVAEARLMGSQPWDCTIRAVTTCSCWQLADRDLFEVVAAFPTSSLYADLQLAAEDRGSGDEFVSSGPVLALERNQAALQFRRARRLLVEAERAARDGLSRDEAQVFEDLEADFEQREMEQWRWEAAKEDVLQAQLQERRTLNETEERLYLQVLCEAEEERQQLSQLSLPGHRAAALEEMQRILLEIEQESEFHGIIADQALPELFEQFVAELTEEEAFARLAFAERQMRERRVLRHLSRAASFALNVNEPSKPANIEEPPMARQLSLPAVRQSSARVTPNPRNLYNEETSEPLVVSQPVRSNTLPNRRFTSSSETSATPRSQGSSISASTPTVPAAARRLKELREARERELERQQAEAERQKRTQLERITLTALQRAQIELQRGRQETAEEFRQRLLRLHQERDLEQLLAELKGVLENLSLPNGRWPGTIHYANGEVAPAPTPASRQSPPSSARRQRPRTAQRIQLSPSTQLFLDNLEPEPEPFLLALPLSAINSPATPAAGELSYPEEIQQSASADLQQETRNSADDADLEDVSHSLPAISNDNTNPPYPQLHMGYPQAPPPTPARKGIGGKNLQPSCMGIRVPTDMMLIAQGLPRLLTPPRATQPEQPRPRLGIFGPTAIETPSTPVRSPADLTRIRPKPSANFASRSPRGALWSPPFSGVPATDSQWQNKHPKKHEADSFGIWSTSRVGCKGGQFVLRRPEPPKVEAPPKSNDVSNVLLHRRLLAAHTAVPDVNVSAADVGTDQASPPQSSELLTEPSENGEGHTEAVFPSPQLGPPPGAAAGTTPAPFSRTPTPVTANE